MMGLEKLKEKPDELLNGRFPHYRRCPVKEHLSEFCRLVCYLVNKKWLTDALSGASGSLAGMKSPMKADKTPSSTVNVKPGCSHWEDAQSQSGSWMSVDSCYLHKFVCSLINGVDNPLWLFEVLQELGDHLSTEVVRSSPTSRQERQNLEIKEACQCYPSVKLLLQRDLDEFSKLLLGPKMATAVDDVSHRRDRRRLEPSEIIHALGHCQLINTRLKDVLKTAKRAFSISDSSGSLFKNLTDEITSQHSILQCLIDRVLKDKELCSSDEREVAMFSAR
ncbi:hypothetical protein OS493_032168 [Desmophyllum pertusum]|uniref:Uncharacterized protein n=1 Tax=Desmophyllum pertusum TaxID=174260 RepID=A0A9W9ZY48_9CNID|nr:hypothetical protein OS493_032168 [Desmophyllum pertusum]